MQKEVYLTHEKLEKIKTELEELRRVRRPEIVARIKEARALGDLSENAEYHSAREEQGFIEGKIEELEYMVKNARMVDEGGKAKDRVGVGSKVICSIEKDGKIEFMIVGSAEADPTSGKISNESPIGKALMGKKVGEAVEVAIPAGNVKYKIVSIK
ncbi:MAG: transcription elongation factor GreA [Patescibacteria group bacterium]|nr:transcription elongation factor GreA [Patescibacteria group bacterium]